jgi:hypothetical protein
VYPPYAAVKAWRNAPREPFIRGFEQKEEFRIGHVEILAID